VCTEAVAVVRAVVADSFLDRWHVEIASDNREETYLGKRHCGLNKMLHLHLSGDS
jgi:hypothetical protein